MHITSTFHKPVPFHPQKHFSLKETVIQALQRKSFKFEPLSPMERKVACTQLKLIELSENDALFSQLVHTHCLFFEKIAHPYPDTITFYNHLATSEGIVQRNLFDQKYYRNIKTFETLEHELIDGEEGTFSIQLSCLTLTIIKFRENNQDHVSQQFMVVNSLKEFTQKRPYMFDVLSFTHDLPSFTQNILDPLRTLLFNDGIWTEQQCDAHNKLTHEDTSDLIGCPVPEDFSSSFKFGRTSDIALLEDNPMDFDKVNKMVPSIQRQLNIRE